MFDIRLLEAEERKHMRISVVITTVLTIILLLLSIIWRVWRQDVLPPGELYEVVGAIDFGNMQEGSRKVNNFEKPVEKPAEVPPPAPKPTPKVSEAEPKPKAEPVITKPDPSPVKEPEAEKVKPTPVKPKETTQPKKEETKPQPKTETPQNTNSTKPSESESTKPSNETSGSNQGNKPDGTGNTGTPDIKKLDPDGLYSFGEGIGGGANQRAPLYLPKPTYDVQEEGDIKFTFTINPDGTVGNVRIQGINTKPGLAQAGIAAIRKWKFTKARPDQSQAPIQVSVTIKFRLRG